jgi:hypothetical protein
MNNYTDQPPRKLFGLALIEYKKSLKLTCEQKDILVGTLLGDASIACKKGKPVCVKFEQKATREKYIPSLFMIFEPYVGTPPRRRTFENAYHKTKPGQSVWFRTYAHESLLFYENLFYIRNQEDKRIKRVPKNIHKLLTPRALAYWFMDDGSSQWSKTTHRLKYHVLNTQGFSLSDQKILVLALKRNFHLNVNINKDRTYYRLYVCADSITHFKDLIRAYVHDDFLYKLDLYKLEPNPNKQK